MQKIHELEDPVHAVHTLSDPGASPRARRVTGDPPGSAAPAGQSVSDSEVVPRARRRHFSNAVKRRILEAADRYSQPGEIDAPMHREGVYSPSLSTWRCQREAADLSALAPVKRGPKAETLQIAQLTRERDNFKNPYGHAQALRDARQSALDAAFRAFPKRFKDRRPQPHALPIAAWINPPSSETITPNTKETAQ